MIFDRVVSNNVKDILDDKMAYADVATRSTFYEEEIEHKSNKIMPKKIISQGPATIVFWNDGTKTIVKKTAVDEHDSYAAFCAALAKKIYGGNSTVKNIVDRNIVFKD